MLLQRKVKFPTEYDALDIVTDELKAKLQPASRRLMEIEKDRMERRKVRKRMKNKASTSQTAAPSDSTPTTEGATMEVDNKPEEGGDLDDESVYRKKELDELEALISPDVKGDVGASPTGLYELVGTCRSPRSLATSISSITRPLQRTNSDHHAQGCRGGCRSLHRIRQEERFPS